MCSPVNGNWPETSSNRMTPSDQMSDRASTVFDELHLLGRHVERGSHDGVRLRHRHAPGGRPRDLRDAEVEHLDGELPVGPTDAEEVRRLEVAVHDAERVRLGDGLARLQHELGGLLHRQRAALARARPTRSRPCEVLHDHVRSAVVERAHVDDARHVLALDLHRRARLALEAGDGVAVLQHLGQQELDRHPLVELQVMGGDDDAHAARRRAPGRRGTCRRGRRRVGRRDRARWQGGCPASARPSETRRSGPVVTPRAQRGLMASIAGTGRQSVSKCESDRLDGGGRGRPRSAMLSTFRRGLPVIRILWGALTFSTVLVVVVSVIVKTDPQAALQPGQLPVLALVAVGAAVASFVLPARMAGQAIPKRPAIVEESRARMDRSRVGLRMPRRPRAAPWGAARRASSCRWRCRRWCRW